MDINDPNFLAQAHAFAMKIELIKRLSYLVAIAFVTIQLLGHIDHWVELIWKVK